VLPVLSLIRSHFPDYVAKHRGRDKMGKRAKGDCALGGVLSEPLTCPHFFLLHLALSTTF